MIFLSLFITFFKIGLFGFGGGYGMLSLIQHETVEAHHWLSTAEFTDIVAISQMTPGPIGINSATYCGYTAIENAGYSSGMAVLGSATATFALVLPSLILMILISKMFMKYMSVHWFASCRCRFVGCCHPVTLQRRELLHAEREPLAILYQLCPAHCNGCRHRLSENQSHPHDLLCRYCGFVVTILKSPV